MLAAQAILIQAQGDEVIVATTNVRHLALFTSAMEWAQITYGSNDRELPMDGTNSRMSYFTKPCHCPSKPFYVDTKPYVPDAVNSNSRIAIN